MLKKYETLTRSDLESNLKHFLTEVCPVAEKAGCIMVIHPDDPPYSILGLPRIFSTIDDVKNLLAMVDSPANGVCFCAGSFSRASRQQRGRNVQGLRRPGRLHPSAQHRP